MFEEECALMFLYLWADIFASYIKLLDILSDSNRRKARTGSMTGLRNEEESDDIDFVTKYRQIQQRLNHIYEMSK